MFKSLSVRLLLVFIVSFIVLLSLLRFGIGYSFNNQLKTFQAASLARMSRIIIDRETNQINIDRATHVAERTGIRIHVITNQSSWSSEGVMPNEEEFVFEKISLKKPPHFKHKKHKKYKPPRVEFANGFKFNIYKVSTKHGVLFFEVDHPDWHFEWYWILIAGLFVLCLYIATRYLFLPIADIKHVVREVSKGNFTARTKTNRQDELGELAEHVDTMANDIGRLVESKRSLLLSISHELRTPLTRAKISSNLLDKSKHSDSLLEDLQEMESIISELIEAEKLSQDTPLARQVCDINSLIKEVLSESFQNKDVTFDALKESAYLNIDPIRIKLLIKNLVKNALQYSIEGKPVPVINLAITKEYLTIKVTDTGVGMPADVLEHLTEPFYRIDKARQRETGGFGLGLYLCQAIVRAHRGKLHIESEEGQGTEVTASILLK